jgi:hypothetical protein
MSLTQFEILFRVQKYRTSSAFTSAAFIVADLVGIMLSFGTGFFLVNAYDVHAINFRSFVMYWQYLPFFTIFFQINSLYPGVALAPAEEVRRFFMSSLMAHGGIILSRYIEDKEWDAISIAFIISFFCSPLILIICRDFMRFILSKTGLGRIPAVIYGNGETGKLIVDRLLQDKKAGYVPALILDDENEGEDEYNGVPILHDTSLGPDIVKSLNIKMAIVTMPNLSNQELKHLLNYSVSAFRYSVLIPDFFNVTNIWMSIRDLGGILGFVTSHRLKMFWNLGAKRFMDLSIVIIGGLVILPLLLLIALVIKISSPGPVLYGHPRLGINGKPFKAYKFRSMVINADQHLKAVLDSDPDKRKEW